MSEKLEPIEVGACPTCGALAQAIAEDGGVRHRHVDTSDVAVEKFRRDVIQAIRSVGHPSMDPRGLVDGGVLDFGGDTLGTRIAWFRRHRRMTQEEVAAAAGISVPFLSEIENDKRNPGSANLLAIADAIGASTDYLLRGPR